MLTNEQYLADQIKGLKTQIGVVQNRIVLAYNKSLSSFFNDSLWNAVIDIDKRFYPKPKDSPWSELILKTLLETTINQFITYSGKKIFEKINKKLISAFDVSISNYIQKTGVQNVISNLGKGSVIQRHEFKIFGTREITLDLSRSNYFSSDSMYINSMSTVIEKINTGQGTLSIESTLLFKMFDSTYKNTIKKGYEDIKRSIETKTKEDDTIFESIKEDVKSVEDFITSARNQVIGFFDLLIEILKTCKDGCIIAIFEFYLFDLLGEKNTEHLNETEKFVERLIKEYIIGILLPKEIQSANIILSPLGTGGALIKNPIIIDNWNEYNTKIPVLGVFTIKQWEFIKKQIDKWSRIIAQGNVDKENSGQYYISIGPSYFKNEILIIISINFIILKNTKQKTHYFFNIYVDTLTIESIKLKTFSINKGFMHPFKIDELGYTSFNEQPNGSIISISPILEENGNEIEILE